MAFLPVSLNSLCRRHHRLSAVASDFVSRRRRPLIRARKCFSRDLTMLLIKLD